MIKAAGTETNVASIIDNIKFCKDACLIFTLENFASKFVEKSTVKKHYFSDNEMLNIFLTDSDTALHENICAVDLHRRSVENSDDEVWFTIRSGAGFLFAPAQEGYSGLL